MDPLTELRLRYSNPEDVGLATQADLDRVLKAYTDVEGTDAVVYHSALARLITLEIAALTRNPEILRVPGQIDVTQGLAVRLRTLRAERRAALAAAGGQAQTGGTLTVVPSQVRW